jgi:hypothetical protein
MLTRGSTILIASAFALGACDKTGTDDKPSSEARPVTNTNATLNAPSRGAGTATLLSAVANASTVQRFADESPMTPTPSSVVPTTTARTMPLGSQPVAVFDKSSDATVLAKRGDYYLVMFPDPKEGARQLAGWIYKDGIGTGTLPALSNPPPAFACTAGDVHVLSSGQCAHACTHDADCAWVGGVCDGNGPVATGSHSVGRAQYCVVPPQAP